MTSCRTRLGRSLALPVRCSLTPHPTPLTPQMHPSSLAAAELLAQCQVRFGRRSGPGGQHRNKVETAVCLEHEPTGIRAEASERRSQAENRKVALRRLRMALAMQYPVPDQAARALWDERLVAGQRNPSAKSDVFPTLVACAMYALDQSDFHAHVSARDIGVSTARLVRFLQVYPQVWQYVNQQRTLRDLKPLR